MRTCAAGALTSTWACGMHRTPPAEGGPSGSGVVPARVDVGTGPLGLRSGRLWVSLTTLTPPTTSASCLLEGGAGLPGRGPTLSGGNAPGPAAAVDPVRRSGHGPLPAPGILGWRGALTASGTVALTMVDGAGQSLRGKSQLLDQFGPSSTPPRLPPSTLAPTAGPRVRLMSTVACAVEVRRGASTCWCGAPLWPRRGLRPPPSRTRRPS